MAPSVLQNGGFVLGLIGTAALVAATTTSKWSVEGRQGDLARSLYSYRGLWQECQTAASGFTECCPLHLTQGFSGAFQAVRALMIASVVLSVFGAVMSLSSLTWLGMSSVQHSTRAKMSLAAGIMFIISGVCGIAGASIYANQIVSRFRESPFSTCEEEYAGNMRGGMPTYTFGPALFVCWIGGDVLVIAGILKAVAFRETAKD